MGRTFTRGSRRGHYYTLAAFASEFPGVDPKKKGDLVDKKCKASGQVVKCVKVYNHDDGVESFSEGDEDHVETKTSVDDGTMVLDEEQLTDAHAWAVEDRLSSLKLKGVASSELRQEAKAAAAAAAAQSAKQSEKNKTGTARSSAKDGDADQDSSSNEDVDEAPLAKQLGLKSKRSKAKKQSTPGKATDGLEKSVVAADRMLASWKGMVENFAAGKEPGNLALLTANASKLQGEIKAVNTKVLVKGDKVFDRTMT